MTITTNKYKYLSMTDFDSRGHNRMPFSAEKLSIMSIRHPTTLDVVFSARLATLIEYNATLTSALMNISK